MRRMVLVLLAAVCCAEHAHALDIVNLRVTEGPLGAKRADSKFLPGDLIFLNFDIKDIHVNKDSGAVQYQTTMEIVNDTEKAVFKQQSLPQKLVLLGGDQLRSSAYAVLGTAQDAGKFKVKLTVEDLHDKKKKTVFYEFEVLPKGFGIVQPATAAVAFVGADLTVGFSLVGMQKDKKTKLPDVALTIRILDGAGKEVTTKPWELNVQLFHNPPAADLTNKEVVPVYFTFFLNRAGTYTIQVDAEDTIGKEKKQIRFPLKVLDPGDFTGK